MEQRVRLSQVIQESKKPSEQQRQPPKETESQSTPRKENERPASSQSPKEEESQATPTEESEVPNEASQSPKEEESQATPTEESELPNEASQSPKETENQPMPIEESQQPKAPESEPPIQEIQEPSEERLSTGNKNGSCLLIVAAIVVVAIGIFLAYKKQQLKRKKQDGRKSSPVIMKAEEKPMLSKIQVSNLHHIGKRENQQDSFCISNLADENLCREKGVLAVVADGMGGLSDGAEVSAIITSYMRAKFPQYSNKLTGKEQLLQLVFGAHKEVRHYLEKEGKGLSGSTVVAVRIKADQLDFISVGDSHIYLFRAGTLILLNREHTYGSQLDEKVAQGEIDYELAKQDEQRKALTSYIGMDGLSLVDRNIVPLSLKEKDRIILATDGVFGTLSEQEMTEALLKDDLYEATSQLELAILNKKKMYQDNFTAIILQIGGGEA